MINSPSIPGLQPGSVFSLELLETRPGYVLFRVNGSAAQALFAREAGGHRWQRVPPTEKRGRVHTSTITVAVLPKPACSAIKIDSADLDETFTRGSGAGGQHRNKTASAVVLRHRPTGLQVRIENNRSQHANRQTALEVLQAKLVEQQQRRSTDQRNVKRRQQVGSGMRGDKIRTIRVRHNIVINHRTGKKMSYDRYIRGFLRELR